MFKVFVKNELNYLRSLMSGGKGGTVRLIDIVLNLLFGFLMITDIIHKNQIKLPSHSATLRRPDKKEEKVLPIEIQIMPGDTMLPDIDLKTEKSLGKIGQLFCYYLVYEENKIYYIRKLDKLEDHLAVAKAAYDSISVIMNPDSNSITQGTINLIDICRKYDIKRKFRYD